MNWDVFLNKEDLVRSCLARIRAKYGGDPAHLRDQDRQDIIVLNLQRACECVIDLAMHVVAVRELDVPQDSRDAFRQLERAGLLDEDLCRRMQRMVGFRNVAVHPYQDLNVAVLQRILEDHLDDFPAFLDAMRSSSRDQRR